MSTDPLNVRDRLYSQVGALLTDLEKGDSHSLAVRIRKTLDDKRAKPETLSERIEAELAEEPGVSMRERIAALVAIGRLELLITNLRKADDVPVSGGKVAQYSTAFRAKTNATRVRNAGARPALVDPFTDNDDTDTDPAA